MKKIALKMEREEGRDVRTSRIVWWPSVPQCDWVCAAVVPE